MNTQDSRPMQVGHSKPPGDLRKALEEAFGALPDAWCLILHLQPFLDEREVEYILVHHDGEAAVKEALEGAGLEDVVVTPCRALREELGA